MSARVIAINHVSFLDAPILLSLMDKPPVFAIDSGIAQRWWVKPFLHLADVRPMDPSKPFAARALVREVEAGRRLVIFPEGRITVTGGLMKIYDGAALIAERSGALVTPVRLEGPERSFFSRLHGSQIGRRLFPKIRVTIAPPRPIRSPPNLYGRARRRAASTALYDIMTDLVFETTNIRRTLHDAVEATVRSRGLGHEVAARSVERRHEPAHVPHRRRGAGAQDRGHDDARRDDRPDAAERQWRGRRLHGAAGGRPRARHAELHRRRRQSRLRLRDGADQRSF